MKKLEEVLKDWEAVIGLEVHAELTTLETKMSCGCKLEFGSCPQYAYLSGLSRTPWCAACAQQSGDRIDRVGGLGHELRHREALDVLPQELYVSRYVEELPDHAGSCRILHARASRPRGGRRCG